jgi:hypothetical protein
LLLKTKACIIAGGWQEGDNMCFNNIQHMFQEIDNTVVLDELSWIINQSNNSSK